VHFSFYTEKVPGEGEDCEPLLVVGQDRSLLAVFDGMGGAGGTVYDTPAGRHSGAWFASRTALDVVQGHLPEIVGPGPEVDGPRAAGLLHDRLREALARRLADFGAPRSSLRSKLLRALPTTMALAYVVRTEPDGTDWVCHCFWAGDSRVYTVDPEDGSHQLTADDLRSDHDALENLVDDAVMDNCISADTDFHINYRRIELRAPFLLLAASDGCFGYVPSPMHFEHLILSRLQAATSVDSWRAGLRSAIESVAGDDATIALLAVGGDLDAIRAIFAPRLEHLVKTYIDPLDDIEQQMRTTVQRADELRQQRLALRSELWSRYKPDYERLLPEPSVPASAAPAEPAGRVEPAAAPAAPPPLPSDAAAPDAAGGRPGDDESEMRTP
jgi:serine/threonine protein phosphatase PrpC